MDTLFFSFFFYGINIICNNIYLILLYIPFALQNHICIKGFMSVPFIFYLCHFYFYIKNSNHSQLCMIYFWVPGNEIRCTDMYVYNFFLWEENWKYLSYMRHNWEKVGEFIEFSWLRIMWSRYCLFIPEIATINIII